MGPFDILKHILEPGGDPSLLEIGDNLKTYSQNQFVINRGLAQSIDTIMFASEANKLGINDPDFHFNFMFHSIKKRKRFSKWAKKGEATSEEIEIIQKHYGVNKEIAIEYLSLMDPDDVKLLLDLYAPACEVPGKRAQNKRK